MMTPIEWSVACLKGVATGDTVGNRREDYRALESETIDEAWYKVVKQVNQHDMVEVARHLGALRR